MIYMMNFVFLFAKKKEKKKRHEMNYGDSVKNKFA